MTVRALVGGANNTDSTSHVVSLPAGIEVGDRLIVGFTNDTATATVSLSAAMQTAGWSILGTQAQGTTTNHRLTILTKIATGGDTLTVTTSSAEASTWVSVCLQGNGGTPTLAQDNGGNTDTTWPVIPITGLALGDYDSLIFVGADASTDSDLNLTLTGIPAGWTFRNAAGEIGRAGTVNSGHTFLLTRAQNTTGFSPGNITPSELEQYVTWHVVLPALLATPIGPITDAGTGTDTGTVDRTRYTAITEPGTATDPAVVFRDYTPFPDGGAGSDTATVDVLTPIGPVLDSGAGSESIEVALFIGNDLTDSGTGSDSITVERTTYVLLTDSGIGDDARALQQTRNLTDSGVGTDTRSSDRILTLADLAVGSEFLRVVDIPFTPILPLRQHTLYELVVVARLPQIAGPPTFVEVDGIEWKDLRYANTLSQASELEASCQISSVTESVLQRLRRPHELASELWLYRNGKIVFAGPLVGWRNSGESLTLSAKGILTYLRLMIIERDLLFVQKDQFEFVKTMVDNWQSLEYGHFGIDTSTIGTSGVLRDGTYYKKELHNVGQRVEELGQRIDGFDADVDPATRKLQLWYPTKGLDRSTGEDAIIVDARNITSGDTLCSVAIGDLASQGYGTGTASGADAVLWSEQSNDDLRTKYGRTAVTATWSDVSDQSTLDSHTRGLIEARKEALIVPGPNVRVTPDADLEDYGVGDTITYDLASLLGVSGAFRIRRQSIKVSPTGKETVDLEFV